MIRKLIEAATKAPSGSNSQPWKFVVIRNEALKRRIGEYYRTVWQAEYRPLAARLQGSVRASSAYLAEHIHEAPVLILACIQHDGSPGAMRRGASIYPAIQNLLLAARGLGLGGVITTMHKWQHEQQVKELLGIPEKVETAALIPIGYPTDGVRYGPTRRKPVAEVTYWDRWGATR